MKNAKSTSRSREVDPERSIIFAIIEQAIDDLRHHQRAGTITKTGRVDKSKMRRHNGTTVKETTVNELLRFFRDGTCSGILSNLGYDIQTKDVCRKLNIGV